MKKLNLLALLILFSIKASAQIDGTLLLGLTPISDADMPTITTPPIGALFYNTDEQKIFVNTPSGFTKIPSLDPNSIDFWSAQGTTGSNSAVNFLGTTDAQDMVFRANNEERLLLSGSNQTVRINGATQFNNHPFVIRANVDDVMAFQTAAGVTEWHWNLAGNGLNFVETGVADFRIFMEQGGNVGISTGTPSERLDVDGSLRVRTINTTASDLDVLVTTAAGVVQKRDLISVLNLKENTANKSIDGTLAGNSNVDFPTEQAVKTYVDNEIGNIALATDGTPGNVSINVGNSITINSVSTDPDNSIEVGTDGGAYLKVYEKIVIWADENAALGDNQLEWSFGNGAVGQIGIPLPEEWEAYAVSFNSDINAATSAVTMAIINSNTNTNLFTFTATGNVDNMVYTEVLATPVTIPVGTSLGFRTVTVTGGTVDNARVAVFLRRLP